MASSGNNSKAKEGDFGLWWRDFIFGDYHSDTRNFLESPWRRAPKEIACALGASCLVSPLVSIMDKCMVQEISGTTQFLNAIGKAGKEMFVQPKSFFGGLSFRLTVIVYFGTYAVANLSELALDVQRIEEDERRKQLKVSSTSVANIGLLAWRDSIFAQKFSQSQKHATPMRTVSLFAVRDATTMYATFYAAPRAAEYLEKEYGVEKNAAELGTALSIPMVAQFLTAPLHIHAMDFYNKPNAPLQDRLATIGTEFKTIAFARGLRILPAFGIGSFSNNKLRELFIQQQPDRKLHSQGSVNAVLHSNNQEAIVVEKKSSRMEAL